jgi:uncharacterized membrane protein HdeD (DUF308 family)
MENKTIFSFNHIVRGVLTLLTGFFLLLMPGLTIKTVLMVIGALLLVNGLINWIVSNKNIRTKGFFSFQGIFNIVIGVFFLLSPKAMLNIFVVFLGIILLIIGIVQLLSSISAFSWRIWSLIYFIFALAMVSGGVLLLYNPFKSFEAIVSFIGMLLIFYGVSQIMSNKVKRRTEYYKGSPIEDIPHEEL